MDRELLNQILKLEKITEISTVNKRSTEAVLKISPSRWQLAWDKDMCTWVSGELDPSSKLVSCYV